MSIDITLLNQGLTDSLYIDSDFSLDMTTDDIKELNSLHVSGDIRLDEIGDINLDLNLSGVMILSDKLTLDDIKYPFNCQIEEKIEKNEENLSNTLDLSEVLWQNIVLEVPLGGFTEVKNLDEFKGDGWRLLSEDDLKKSNNPFDELKTMFGEE